MELEKAQQEYLKRQVENTSLTLGARNLIGLLVNERGIFPASRLDFDTPRRREERYGKAHATHAEYLIEIFHAASSLSEITESELKSLVSGLLEEKTKEAKKLLQPAYYAIKSTIEEQQVNRSEMIGFINEHNDGWHYAVMSNSGMFTRPIYNFRDQQTSSPANISPARKILLHAMMGIPGETFEQNAREVNLAQDALVQVYRSLHIDSDKAHELAVKDRAAIAISLYSIRKYAFTITQPEWQKTLEVAPIQQR